MKALFIGRFQPFHQGHLLLLQQLAKQYDEIIIGIGSSQYQNTSDNPFSEAERIQMITKSLETIHMKNYRLVSIPDIHNPPKWVDHVCSIVSNFDLVIANNPLTRKLFSEKGFEVKGTTYFDRKRYSGKEIRRRIIEGEPWEELVPQAVCDIIKNNDGITRLKQISH